jgi:hypothetical protein
MTTHFASPIGHYDANPDRGEPTVRRQAVLEPLAPTKSGWIVSGLAAALAASALAVVGNLAIHQFATTEVPAVAPSSSTSLAPTPASAPTTISPAAVPAPVVAAAPTAPERDRPGVSRVVVVTVPAAPIAIPKPVVSSPTPVEPPAPVPLPNNPSGGIGTCDLVDCHPVPPSSGGIPSCGDFRACGPVQPVQPSRPRD